MDRGEGDEHLHRRAVGVGDDPAVRVERLGIHLGDHQRDVVVHPPVARVVDHDGARLDQLRRPLGAHRAAGRREHQVEAVDRLAPRAAGTPAPCRRTRPSCPPSARRRRRPPRPPESRARRARGAWSSRPRPWRRGRRPCSRRPPSPTGRRAGRCSVPVGSSRRTASSPRSNAWCRAFTAAGTSAASITQEILIGEVEIISMLIPLSPSIWKTFAATPGWLRIPAPTIDTLPIRSSVRISLAQTRARRAPRSPPGGRRGRP